MFKILLSLAALIAAISLVTVANATMTTILPLRMLLNGASATAVALFGASYFIGFTVGCFSEPPRILRVGFIRAFAAAAALCTSLAIVIDRTESVALWIVLRFFMGLCIAAIFASVDGWINATTPDSMRGRVFSVYGWCIGASSVVGQILLVIWDGVTPGFIVILALAFNAAVILVTLTRSTAPEVRSQDRSGSLAGGDQTREGLLVTTSATAIVTAIYAGLVTTAILAIFPALLAEKGIPDSVIALVIASFFVGRLVFQIPVGIIADKVDLRMLIAGTALATGVVALLAAFFILTNLAAVYDEAHLFQKLLYLLVMLVLGGLILPLYTVANSLAFARADGQPPVKIATTLLLVNSAGAVAGPMLIAMLFPVFGQNALPGVIVGASALMTAFALWQGCTGEKYSEVATARSSIPTTSVSMTAIGAEVQAEAKSEAAQSETSP